MSKSDIQNRSSHSPLSVTIRLITERHEWLRMTENMGQPNLLKIFYGFSGCSRVYYTKSHDHHTVINTVSFRLRSWKAYRVPSARLAPAKNCHVQYAIPQNVVLFVKISYWQLCDEYQRSNEWLSWVLAKYRQYYVADHRNGLHKYPCGESNLTEDKPNTFTTRLPQWSNEPQAESAYRRKHSNVTEFWHESIKIYSYTFTVVTRWGWEFLES